MDTMNSYMDDTAWFARRGIDFNADQFKILQKLHGVHEVPFVDIDRGCGKTFALAAITARWVYKYPLGTAIVIVVSPMVMQGQHCYLKQFQELHQKLNLYGTITKDGWTVESIRVMQSLSTAQFASVEGIHRPATLILFDEFAGFNPRIWERAEVLTAGKVSRMVVVGTLNQV